MASNKKRRVPEGKNCIEDIARNLQQCVVTSGESCTKALQFSNRLLECDKKATELCSKTLFKSIHDNFASLLTAKKLASQLIPLDVHTLHTISEINTLVSANIEAAVESSKRQMLRKNRHIIRKKKAQIIDVEDYSERDKTLVPDCFITTGVTEHCKSKAPQPRKTKRENVSLNHQNSISKDLKLELDECLETTQSSKDTSVLKVDQKPVVKPAFYSNKDIKILSSYRLASDPQAPCNTIWEDLNIKLTYEGVTKVFSGSKMDIPASPGSEISDIVESSEKSLCVFESRRLESWVGSARGTDPSLGQNSPESSDISPDRLFGDGLLIIKKTIPLVYNRRTRKKKRRRKKVRYCQLQTTTDINPEKKQAGRSKKKDTNVDKNKKKLDNRKKNDSRNEVSVVFEGRYGRTIRKPQRYGTFAKS